MKIAHVAPLYESVPPKFYGGTERIISYLTVEDIARHPDHLGRWGEIARAVGGA